MQVTSILIGGVEMISVCRKEATEINVESNGKMSTARLEAVFDMTATSAGDSSKVGTAVVGTAVVGTATLGLTLGVQQSVAIYSETNLLMQTEDFGVAPWGKDAPVTVTSNYGVAPDGSTTSTRLQFADAYQVVYQYLLSQPAGPYSGAVYVKGTAGETIRFGLTTETPFVAKEENYTLTGYWQRIAAPVATSTAVGYLAFNLSTYGGATARDIQVWGGQVNAGSELLAYSRVIYERRATLFTGFVARLSPQVISPNLIRYAIDCQDNTRLLDRAIVASATYTAWSDEAILDDLFATYLPAITTTGVIGKSPETVLDSITFENLSLRACVDRICERTGAEWRLGFDSDLKYYAVASNGGEFDFSDSADGGATEFYLQSDFGYQEEFSQPANAVSVVGYQAPKPDQASIVLPVGAAADDGFVYAYSSIHWPPTDNLTADTAGAAFFLYSSFSGGIYQFSNAFIRFDTSAIPAGATIVSAVLKLYGVATSGIYDRAVGADYFDSSNWPIGVEDYSADPATLTGYEPSAIDWRDLAPFNLGGFGSVPTLLELALKDVANIPVSGYVGLRIFAGKSGVFMTDSFQVQIDSVSSTTVRYRPTLTITYQEPQPAPIAGYAEDAASITLYGTFSKTIADNGITTEGEADARAAVETVRYGYPRKSINCTYDRDGLTVGDTVHFVSSLLGIDDEFIVKRLRLRWPRTQDGTRYYAELGEARADLIEILRKG